MVFFFESLQNKRSRNEDSCCHMEFRMNHEAAVSAYAIADGMGGLSEGNRYSCKAVSLWYEELLHVIMSNDFRDCSLKSQIETLKNFSENVFSSINRTLYKDGMDAGIKGGTTLTTAIHFWDSWIIANCGDSPVFIVKKEEVSLVSQIQNVAWQLVREGKTKEGSLLFQQNKNRLIEYLGRRESVHPCCLMLNDREVDQVLMGTDGAFGNLTHEEIASLLRTSDDPSTLLPRMMEAARDLGETDNQTAFLIGRSREEMIACSQEDLESAAMEEQYEDENDVETYAGAEGKNDAEIYAGAEGKNDAETYAGIEGKNDAETYVGVEGKDYVQAEGILSRFFSRRRS